MILFFHDNIPWVSIFSKIVSVNNDLILNPEVFNLGLALETRKFCIDMINEVSRKEGLVITSIRGEKKN